MSDTASMVLPWTHARHHHHQHASADGESVNSLSRPGGEHMLHTSTQVTTYHLHQPWPPRSCHQFAMEISPILFTPGLPDIFSQLKTIQLRFENTVVECIDK